MNITFIAPPAAGKGAISNKIFEKYGYPHISIGDLLRNVDDEDVKKELEQGAFVSNDIVKKLLYSRLSKDDCKNGFVLDGFPRNNSQISIYDDICLNSDLKNIIIVLDVPRDVCEKRITGRRVCPNCGRVYNINFDESRPLKDGKCDNCSSDVIRRSDDNYEVYNHRYEVYLNETSPILEHYKNSGFIYFVDGTGSVDEVFERVDKVIKENL